VGDNVTQLLYCSRKTRALDELQLRQMVEQAARHNGAAGISGTLLAGGGLFLQLLEGPQRAVDELWERIQADRRHTKPTLMMKNLRGGARLYPALPMALLFPALPLEFMTLARDVREHVNAHARWHMEARELAALVDRTARRVERAEAGVQD